eukprot:GILK01001484.1.p1 GENE.GILK01001484.1~~GILK01001484.1.p1  ORF type:complete len:481 (-),score=47.86 GILK01001484.1:247-1689(-)
MSASVRSQVWLLLAVVLVMASTVTVTVTAQKCSVPRSFDLRTKSTVQNMEKFCDSVMELSRSHDAHVHFQGLHSGIVEEGQGCPVCHWEDGRLPPPLSKHDNVGRMPETFRAILTHLINGGLNDNKFLLSRGCISNYAEPLLSCVNTLFPYESLPHETQTEDYTLFDAAVYRPLGQLMGFAARGHFCSMVTAMIADNKCTKTAKEFFVPTIRLHDYVAGSGAVTFSCETNGPVDSSHTIDPKSVLETMRLPVFQMNQQTILSAIKSQWGKRKDVHWFDLQTNSAFLEYAMTERTATVRVCNGLFNRCALKNKPTFLDPAGALSSSVCEAMFDHLFPYWIFERYFAQNAKYRNHPDDMKIPYESYPIVDPSNPRVIPESIYRRLHSFLSFTFLPDGFVSTGPAYVPQLPDAKLKPLHSETDISHASSDSPASTVRRLKRSESMSDISTTDIPSSPKSFRRSNSMSSLSDIGSVKGKKPRGA